MNDVLVEKLRRMLAAPVTTEEQAVYVLVQTRKLLDIQGYSKDQWKPVRFLCDWAVHTELDRRTGWANDLLTFVDGIISSNKSWDTLSTSEQEYIQKNFGLHSVRDALMEVLRINHIPPIAFGHPIGWSNFLMRFSSAVAGSSLRLKGGQYVEEVKMQISEGNSIGTRLDVEWTFTRKDHTAPFQWIMPTIIEVGDGHFGRGGKASDERFEGLLRDAGLMKVPSSNEGGSR